MPDIIITPSSGIIDFFPVSARVGRIEGSGNTINISNPSGYIAASGSGLSINTTTPNSTLHAFSSVSGATLFNLEGTNGSLFSVVDNLSGSLMSVNNNAGLPVFEVFSDDRIIGGRFGQNDFVMTSGGNIGIGTGVPSSKFHVVGTSTFGGDISSTGSFIAGSGSAGNPSFEFSGDTDTGMFSPSSNTLAFSTSGVERLRIIDAGRVGIGTSVPQAGYILDINGATVNRGNFVLNGNVTEFGNSRYQFHSLATSNSYSWVCNGGGNFGVGFSAPSGRVAISGGVSIGSNYNLTPPTNGLIVEGNVGIATSSPSARLHATIADGNSVLLLNRSTTLAGISLDFTNGFSNLRSYYGLKMFTGSTTANAGTERVHFTDTGLVGIGTSTPSGQLHVIGTGLFSNSIGINTNTTSVGATPYALLVDGDVSIGSGNAGRTLNVWSNNSTKKTVIKNVNGTSFLTYNIGSQNLNIGGPQPTDSPFNTINYYAGNPTPSTASHRFHVSVDGTGIAPIAVITNSGLGIGTTTPSGQLHVVGSGIFSSGIYANNIGITGNMVFATNTNGNLIIKPNGNGALQADNTGNSRGLYSVDLQRSRASVSGVSAGDYSVIVGGNNNRCSSTNSIVVGGNNNTCSGYTSTIGGGGLNTNTSEYGVIAGGVGNTAAGFYGSCVGGGYYNTSSGYAATVAGGRNNNSTNNYSCIGGGRTNTASGADSTIGGGYNNTASGSFSTIGGGNSNTASAYAGSTVGGGQSNTASGTNSTVCGGTFNTASNGYCTVTGGRSNTSSNTYAAVGGGYVNTASGAGSIVGGGKTNTASGYCSAIAGGISNNASGSQSAVCGGSSNTVSGTCSTVGGGTFNTSSGSYSTVTGGKECVSHQYGEEARSSGKFVDNGDAQVRKLLMRGKTNVTNNTVLLTLDGSLKDISTIDNSCIISHHRYDANDSSKQYTWLYNIKVVARHISATTPTSAAYKFEGILESSSAAGVILLGNTKTVIYEDNADFDCNIYEYNTNSVVRTDGLYIEVSNSLSADEDIYWVAYVEILEVGITEYDAPAY